MKSKRIQCERGATLVEASIALPVFIFLVIGAVELLRFGYYSLSTQFTASSVLRSAAVGPQVFRTGNYANANSPFRAFITGEILSKSKNLGVMLDEQDVEVTCLSSPNCISQVALAGSLVNVRVQKRVEGLFVGRYTVVNDAMIQNELWVF